MYQFAVFPVLTGFQELPCFQCSLMGSMGNSSLHYLGLAVWGWNQLCSGFKVWLSDCTLVAQIWSNLTWAKFGVPEVIIFCCHINHLWETHIGINVPQCNFKDLFCIFVMLSFHSCYTQEALQTWSWPCIIIFDFVSLYFHYWLWGNVCNPTFLVPLLQLRCAGQRHMLIVLFRQIFCGRTVKQWELTH